MKIFHTSLVLLVFLISACSDTHGNHSKYPGDPGVNGFLKNLFDSHGVKAEIANGCVVLKNGPLKINGAIVNETKHPNVLVLQLDIRFWTQTGNVILESFAGIGKNKEEALESALQSFTVNDFHVMLAAFFQPDDQHIDVGELEIAGTKREVIFGNIGVRGKPPELVPGGNWFSQFEKQLKASRLTGGLHWIRFYYGHMGGKTIQCEMLLDNKLWKPMAGEMLKLSWPKSDDFYSFRIFVIIKDK
ncbi:MAG: hypothetical protein GY765_18785 [bacterium]|nr:hypothetical protein [bacterium]